MVLDGNKLIREISGLALLFFSVLLCLSLASFSAQDPHFNRYLGPDYAVQNQAGVIGAYLSGFLVEIFGIGSWLVPVWTFWAGLHLLFRIIHLRWFRWLGIVILFFCLVSLAESPWVESRLQLADMHGGGWLGNFIYSWASLYLHSMGALVVWIFAFLVGLQLSFRLSWKRLVHLGQVVLIFILEILIKVSFLFKRKKSQNNKQKFVPKKAGQEKGASNLSQAKPNRPVEKKAPLKKTKEEVQKPVAKQDLSLSRPSLDLLSKPFKGKSSYKQEDLEELSKKLTECLLDFGVQGKVVQVRPGPVVTMFEYKPAPGIKVSKIANLNDDLALALKAIAVRIVAPIPGKDTVGIEIPNKDRQTVFFREVLEETKEGGIKLPLALGQDIQGNSVVKDLAGMPHLLVAGATGAGKSVCLNSVIVSLLFKHSPKEMKMVLVDPKRIEMSAYAELPHLVHPVVTEMELAKTALDWAVYEMDRRYQAMSSLSARNIEGYNKKLAELKQSDPEGSQGLEAMPYLVIIIDELSDLMLTAGKEAEASIVRLAQLARAAGIHLILATQRPSVDVVTGLIKANFPARIAFQVSSKHDSRTILDAVGAQYLLGKGDMLFKTSAGKLERIHGAFINDEEIEGVIDFWRQKYPQEREVDLEEWKSRQEAGGAEEAESSYDDPMYEEALNFVREHGKASISMIQRHLRIGFNRAARFVEQMEKDGVIGPQEGSKPRSVLGKQ